MCSWWIAVGMSLSNYHIVVIVPVRHRWWGWTYSQIIKQVIDSTIFAGFRCVNMLQEEEEEEKKGRIRDCLLNNSVLQSQLWLLLVKTISICNWMNIFVVSVAGSRITCLLWVYGKEVVCTRKWDNNTRSLLGTGLSAKSGANEVEFKTIHISLTLTPLYLIFHCYSLPPSTLCAYQRIAPTSSLYVALQTKNKLII